MIGLVLASPPLTFENERITMGRIDPPGPTCDACGRPLVKSDGGSMVCVNTDCPKGRSIADRDNN